MRLLLHVCADSSSASKSQACICVRFEVQPEVLLNWGYHTDCPGDGFKCFMTEVSSMLTERLQYVSRLHLNSMHRT